LPPRSLGLDLGRDLGALAGQLTTLAGQFDVVKSAQRGHRAPAAMWDQVASLVAASSPGVVLASWVAG
jgi:hypothetical protein